MMMTSTKIWCLKVWPVNVVYIKKNSGVSLSIFDSVVSVVFQIIFRTEIYANDVF
jgi:hypothetical protein